MSHSLAPPPPATSVRGFFRRAWTEQDSRSTLIGVLGVLLIHLLLWWLGPHLLRIDGVSAARPQEVSRQFNIELAPDAFAKPEPKVTPSKFVETNPDAPENVPDKTENFGAHNQQVAQEKPTPDGRSDRPALEGKKDFESTQIVSGQLTKPVEHMEAVPALETPPSDVVTNAPKAEQNPLAGFEKKEGENKESFGSNVTRIPENTRPIPERIEGAKNVPLIEGATAMQPMIDPRRPQPRRQIANRQVRPAILAENKLGTSNIGPVSYDAKWSNYGSYLQRMIEAVQFQWERLLIDGKIYPPSGTTVTVKFVLNSEGMIARIVSVENHSTERAERVCISAITDRAPYGVWTDDMKAVLGNEQELTFSFHYQ